MIGDKKSYLKSKALTAGISAVSMAVIILTSCDGWNGKRLSETEYDPAGVYREYLSEIRKPDELPFGDLAAQLMVWRTIRDSVFTHIQKDTTLHTGTHEKCALLHDSIRAEFSRLVLSRPRTYKEVLALKEQLSSYAGDEELRRSAEEIRPFFAALDKRPACRGNSIQVRSAYHALLSETLTNGIHSRKDLMEFIEKEDAVYRAFLVGLHDLGQANVSDITRDTEKCCSEIFLAAQRKEITYKEATICMAMRTNRRLIQNVRTCLDDIRRGMVKSPQQAHAYIWMILQPYVLLDDFCMMLLSPEDKAALDEIAEETPRAFETLHQVLQSDSNRLPELPGMLMEIFIASM